MPATMDTLVTLSAVDATRLLHELAVRHDVPIADAPSGPAQLLIEAGLAYVNCTRLVAADPACRTRVIRAIVQSWLPDVLTDAREDC